MEIIAIIKTILLAASYATCVLSIIFLLFPNLYMRIESTLNSDLLQGAQFFTSLEGKIDFLNDWIIQNRMIFGTLFVLLSLYNIKSLILM